MSIRRFTSAVDGTIPVPALLHDDEELLASQENVGIYDGNLKSPRHQSGSIHATSHRLFFISAQSSTFPASGTAEVDSDCFALDLVLIQRTEHYAGLFASSPKITLHLSRPAGELRGTRVNADARASRDGLVSSAALGWECEVCGNKNLPGANPHVARVCGLCGVPAANVPGGADASSPSISTAPKTVARPMPAHIASSASHLSSSLPVDSSMASLGRKDSSAPDHGGGCPVCTFLNHPSLRECEMCGTPLPRTQRAPALSAMTMVKSAPSSRPHSPIPSDDDDEAKEGMLRISFRRAGDKAFYAVLKGVLQARAWETKQIAAAVAAAASSTDGAKQIGIHGVLSTLSTTTQTTSDSLSSAFTDLEALMTQAGAMVKLAGDLSAKLASVEAAAVAIPGGTASAAQPEDAAFIRSSLAQLGMTLPGGAAVATAADGDERAWHVQLARELATVLQGSTDPRAPSHGKGIMTDRGVLALDEVWGAWNRARGVALLPPATLLAVLPLIPGATDPPVHARTFGSGLRVLHTPDLAPAAFATRAVAAAPRTAVETARAERLAVGLAAEMLAEAEQAGELVRDDPRTAGTGAQASAGQVRWWANEWRGYIWDGQEGSDAAL